MIRTTVLLYHCTTVPPTCVSCVRVSSSLGQLWWGTPWTQTGRVGWSCWWWGWVGRCWRSGSMRRWGVGWKRKKCRYLRWIFFIDDTSYVLSVIAHKCAMCLHNSKFSWTAKSFYNANDCGVQKELLGNISNALTTYLAFFYVKEVV